MSNNYKYEMLNDNELGDIKNNINVVIIPSMEVVNEEIIENIGEILNDGKGVLITGNFAQFDDNGNYINRDYLKSVTGFQISKLSGDNGLTINHSLTGNTPLSIDLKPGQKILLNTKPGLYYSYNLSKDNIISGNYLLGGGEYTGIVQYLTANKRLLWYGFGFDQLIGINRNRLIFNSLSWLSSTPRAFINYWPGKKHSASIMYKNIEITQENFNDFLKGGESYKPDFFFLPGILQKSGQYLNRLKNSADINILWNDFYFSRLDNREKSKWLTTAKSSINKFSDQLYYGVSSYGEFYDSMTYKLLNETGYSFIFSSGYSDSFSFDYDSTDDIYVFNQSDSPGNRYDSRLDFVLNAGGIGYICIDSVEENIFNLLSDKNSWITTFSDILDWNAKKQQLEISMYTVKNNIYEINVENKGSAAVANAGIWISIPDINGNINLENSWNDGELAFDSEKKMYFLEVFSLGGYQKASFRISVTM